MALLFETYYQLWKHPTLDFSLYCEFVPFPYLRFGLMQTEILCVS